MIQSARKTYAMLGSSNIWDVAQQCDRLLRDADVPHAIVGGVAVCLHGYQRNTIDVDLLIRRNDAESVRGILENAGYVWHADAAEFHSSEGIPVQFLFAEEPAGNDRSYAVSMPDPDDDLATTEIEGLKVVSLARLIELKIACGLGNLRRTHRDLADVVELIAAHQLGRDFARFLHKSVRKEFRSLVHRARGEL